MIIRRTLMLWAVALSSTACGAGIGYGELPAGPSSFTENKDVSAEICGDYLFDPSSVSARLPDGYRLVEATALVKQDNTVRALVQRDSRLATYGVGTLCFVALSSFIVDDVPVHQPGVAEMAFWWARAEGPGDSNMRGTVEWVQLASWYGPDFTDRRRIIATDPMAQFADVEMNAVEPDLWRMRLTLPDDTVEAEVRLSGKRIKRTAPEPGFSSVVLSGDSARYFVVFTYFGHHHRAAEGTWQARGTGFFSRALQDPSVFGTLFQDGWQGLSGLYRFQEASQ